jgi:uncharacterized protein YoxC
MLTTTKIIMHAGNAEISMDQLVVGVEFGTFELEIGKTEMTAKAQEINIVIDQSGSMGEMCEDGNSKMNQIKHVTKNIMRFICDAKNVTIGINSFNSQVNPVFDRTHITSENVEELTAKLKEVNAEDGTNIELPLRMLRDLQVADVSNVSSETYRNNIFMSDGDANEGATSPDLLAHLVDVRATNYFIGFGLEHNPKLFSALSNRENSSYYFIDKIEKSGIAYGEILQSILYRAMTNVKIIIDNGLLYDWKTNNWQTEVTIGKMSGEMKRTFHILTSAKRDVKITVTGQNVETGENIETVVEWMDASADLSRFIYRQKTQELLHRVKMLNEDSKQDRDTVQEMKDEMKAFMANMVAFMKKNDLKEDRIMKNLCDDIVVIYRTIGTRFGHMYSCSRQVSNGMERAHNTSDTPRAPHRRGYKRGLMPRQCSVMTQEEDVFEFPEVNSDDDVNVDYLMDKHEMSPLFYTSTQEDVINSLTNEDDK